MTDEQRNELKRDRLKAANTIAAANDRELIDGALAVAGLMREQGQNEACDLMHRIVARLEGPEFDGVLT